jgi:Ca2+-binding EF-hand superfamily protein
LHRDGIRLSIWTDPGKAGAMWTKSRQGFINQFVAADADRAGFLDEKSSFALKDRGLKVLLTFADRNGDGKLTRAEFDAWLTLMDELTRGQVLVTVLDHGKGLFECLDADSDGVLSVRELRTAPARLEKAGCIRDGVLDLHRLPRTIRVTVSQGHPKSALPIPKRAGPDWFLAMDRNGDGDVSRREWVGDPALFDKYDLDRDGLLSAEEAEKVVLKQK